MLICIFSVFFAVNNNWINVNMINIEIENLPDELVGLKIVHITDLHLPQNASSINHIISSINEQSPDLILMTGDIVDKSARLETCGLNEFLRGVSEIAPVFSVWGNHEEWIGQKDKINEIMSEYDINILNNQYAIYQYKGKNIIIIGLYDSALYNSKDYEGLENYKDLPVILLAHHPESAYNYCSDNNKIIANLVLSGHTHGGQIRLPFVGGLYAPNQGFFPDYDTGLYKLGNNCQMYISRGLGNSIFPFRINNRPEIPIIIFNNA